MHSEDLLLEGMLVSPTDMLYTVVLSAYFVELF